MQGIQRHLLVFAPGDTVTQKADSFVVDGHQLDGPSLDAGEFSRKICKYTEMYEIPSRQRWSSTSR